MSEEKCVCASNTHTNRRLRHSSSERERERMTNVVLRMGEAGKDEEERSEFGVRLIIIRQGSTHTHTRKKKIEGDMTDMRLGGGGGKPLGSPLREKEAR